MSVIQAIRRVVRGNSTRSESRALSVSRTGGGITSTLASVPSWLERLLIGSNVDDGETGGMDISEATQLQISTVFACIRNISDDVAKLPLHVYRMRDRGRERVRDMPLLRVLARPNPDMTAFTFRAVLTAHAIGWGNGYAEIVRLGNGRPAELWPMLPDRVTIQRRADGSIIYVYANPYTGRQVTLESDDVLHIMGPSLDGFAGLSIVQYARRSMGISAASERFGASFFGNSSMPRGVLEHPARLNKEASKTLRDSWEEIHKGAANANKIAILEEGMKFHAITIPPEDAQFLETRQFQIPEICRWYRMPPHKVADLSKASYSNIEHSNIDYVTDTLFAWLVRWEQEIERKLLMQGEQSLDVEHQTRALLRGDHKARNEAHAVGRQWGWLSANDVRDVEGDPLIPEEKGGDVYLVPANMQNSAKIVDAPAPDPTQAGAPTANPVPASPAVPTPSAQAVRAVAVATAQRSIARLRRVQNERLATAARKGEPREWILGFSTKARDEIAAELATEIRAIAASMSKEVDVDRLSREAASVLIATATLTLGEDWREDIEAKTRALGERVAEDAAAWLEFVERRIRQ